MEAQGTDDESRARVVRPPESLDMLAAADLKSVLTRLVNGPRRTIVIDMSAVTYLDALPLVVILAAARRAADAGSEVRVAGLKGQPREFAQEWALAEHVPTYESLAAAIPAEDAIAPMVL